MSCPPVTTTESVAGSPIVQADQVRCWSGKPGLEVPSLCRISVVWGDISPPRMTSPAVLAQLECLARLCCSPCRGSHSPAAPSARQLVRVLSAYPAHTSTSGESQSNRLKLMAVIPYVRKPAP